MVKQCALTSSHKILLSNISMVVPQRRTWTWNTVSGRMSTSSPEPSKCFSVNCRSHCFHLGFSSLLWRPSVSKTCLCYKSSVCDDFIKWFFYFCNLCCSWSSHFKNETCIQTESPDCLNKTFLPPPPKVKNVSTSIRNLKVKLMLLSFVLTEIKEPKQKVQAVKKLIQQLPKPNHDTMKLLFSHLHK